MEKSKKNSEYKMGIDLGGSHIAIGVVDEDGKILEKIEKKLKGIVTKEVKKVIENTIVEAKEKFSKEYKITKIGIAIPGTVTKEEVIKSVNLGLKNYKIVEELKKKVDLPIKIRNDAKCAAIAESTYGSLKQYKRTLFLTLGTGIGGAVIIDNKLLDTGNLPGCEIGHMVIEKDGLECNCGKKGCFEKYASMKVFKNNLRKALGFDESVSGKELLALMKNTNKYDDNYKIIQRIKREFIENLALGISNLVNIFEPEAVGIGGSFVYFEEVLLEDLKKELLTKNLLFNPRKEINIQTAVLGNEAGIIGAIL